MRIIVLVGLGQSDQNKSEYNRNPHFIVFTNIIIRVKICNFNRKNELTFRNCDKIKQSPIVRTLLEVYNELSVTFGYRCVKSI